MDFWRERSSLYGDMTITSFILRVGKALQEARAFSDGTSAAYWLYHFTRMSFFAAQGGASVLLQALTTGDLQKGVYTMAGGSLPVTYIPNMAMVRQTHRC